MKRILLTTTSLVLAAGVAQAEVTFSGKMEAGVSRTEEVKAGTVVAGKHATAGTAVTASATGAASAPTASATTDTIGFVAGTLTTVAKTAAGTMTAIAADGTGAAAAANSLGAAQEAVRAAQVVVYDLEVEVASAATAIVADTKQTALAVAQANLAVAEAIVASYTGTPATAAVAAGDVTAYSGYDMDVAVSSTLDNGMVVSAAFDMGAGNIADRDDDRVLDAQAAAVALSAVTIKNGGVTYVIGQNKIDDVYDDTQNGDVSVSGAMGGISYTLVADLDKDTAEVKASTTYTASNLDAGTIDYGDADFVNAKLTKTAAVAAVYESTSLKLSGAAAGVTWSFATTNKDDFGDAASRVSLGYAAGDALSFTLTHDTDGSAEAINTLKASYTMDAITLTVSGSDDKDHARNTNTGGKASQNMTIAYASGPLTASFNNDESSQWWATTKYDLGNGADIFATVDHQEFAVVGMSFAF